MPRDVSAIAGVDSADRELLVAIFADVLAGDDWRMRNRVASHMGALAAARPSDEEPLIVAVDYRDLSDLASSIAWALRRAWSLGEAR